MKLSKYISRLVLLIALPLLAGGCSDVDFSDRWNSEDEGNVSLMLPSFSRFTRAGNTELTISSLYFFAFPQDGKGEFMVEDLAVSDKHPAQVVGKYKEYRVKIKPGNYKFYIAANYPFDNIQDITEKDLKGKEIVYDSNFDGSKPENGIPMSCDHSGFKESATGNYFSDSGSYEIKSGDKTTLYADMVFDVAKVSLTLNDGFGNPLAIDGIKAERLSSALPLFRQEGFSDYGSFGRDEMSLSRKGAGCVEEVEVSSGHNSGDDASENGGESTSGSSLDMSKYHDETITFYVPERIVNNPSDEQTKLTITAGGKEIRLLLGDNGRTDSNASGLPQESDRKRLDRGVHYSYTINVKGEITLSVADWTPVDILYTLHGPVFLHLDKTAVEVVAGNMDKDKQSVWFDTNVDELKFESPKYVDGDTETDLYHFEVIDDHIYVSVNPAISPDWFDEIMKEENKSRYDYFHVIAGNLYKKVDVNPLVLKKFLIVEPTEFTINVREEISSGVYAGYEEFTVKTNLRKIRLKKIDSDWEVLKVDAEKYGEKKSLYLEDDKSQIVDFNGTPTADYEIDESGIVTFRIYYNGLNEGREFWTEDNYQFKLKVLALENDGTVAKEEDKALTEDLTINTVRMIDDYIIHFRAYDWALPHIYVYQCLEFPANFEGVIVDDKGEMVSLASKPIGYSDNKDNGTHKQYAAALEYAFTNGIAFKGWDYSYNKESLNLENYSKGTYGSNNEGFFIFDGNNGLADWNKSEWNAGGDNPTNRYYTDMDFCSSVRDEISKKCPQCKNLESKRLWPGIQMIEEGDGWWKFTLSGVATPGKALIMFTDGHKYVQGQNRYPEENKVGVPLFDYPSHEGWFDYANSSRQFVSTRPQDVIYRVSWPVNHQDSRNAINCWIPDSGVVYKGKVNTTWNNPYENNRFDYYYDIKVSKDATDVRVQLYNYGNNGNYSPDNGRNIISDGNTSSKNESSYDYYHKFY